MNQEFEFFEDFENRLSVIHKFTFTIKLLICKISKRWDFKDVAFILFLTDRKAASYERHRSISVSYVLQKDSSS